MRSQLVFIWGFILGLSGSALLFYFWHTESVLQLQQQWLVQLQTNSAVTQKQNVKSPLELIDLLMKSYSISDGYEDKDIRSELVRNQHLILVQQLQQQVSVDISDLLSLERPFNSAQLYAALLRMKHQHEKKQARQLLDQQQQLLTTTPVTAEAIQ